MFGVSGRRRRKRLVQVSLSSRFNVTGLVRGGGKGLDTIGIGEGQDAMVSISSELTIQSFVSFRGIFAAAKLLAFYVVCDMKTHESLVTPSASILIRRARPR